MASKDTDQRVSAQARRSAKLRGTSMYTVVTVWWYSGAASATATPAAHSFWLRPSEDVQPNIATTLW